MLTECENIAKELSIHEYTVKFVLSICLSKISKEHYLNAGYSQELWHSRFFDLRYKLIECKLVMNIDGTFVANWFMRFFNLTRFGFKRLQFEISTSKVNFELNGNVIKVGDPVINIHIPRTETPLSPIEFEQDFETAAHFFKDNFTRTQIPFVCHSWLLFSKLRDFLSSGSNILAFMNRFHTFPDDYLAEGEYHQIWRLFGHYFLIYFLSKNNCFTEFFCFPSNFKMNQP